MFTREESQPFTEFSSFSNFARQPDDEISLKISHSDLDFILEKMTWSSVNLKIGLKFITLASDSYDNRKIKMPYVIALETINELANVAVNQYK